MIKLNTLEDGRSEVWDSGQHIGTVITSGIYLTPTDREKIKLKMVFTRTKRSAISRLLGLGIKSKIVTVTNDDKWMESETLAWLYRILT